MKKPKVGEKLHVPRIGVCRIVSIHYLQLSVLVKRGSRHFLISFRILSQLRKRRYHTVFEGWDRPTRLQGIIVTQPRFSYWRHSPERGEPWQCEGR